MNKNLVLVAVGILIVGAAAYWAAKPKAEDTDVSTTSQAPVVTSGENAQPGGIHDLSVEPAAAIARSDLAKKLSVDEKSIVIMQITETTWTDGCLGLGGPAESCLQAMVPGFKVEMLAKGKTYFYRTDKTGSSFRAEGN